MPTTRLVHPTILVLHHSLTKDSGTVSWGAIRKYHTETLGWDDIGYHWGSELIGIRYEILTGRMMIERGAHVKHHNYNSLGFCFIGNHDKDEVPPEMWELGIRFVRSVCAVFNIETEWVLGHRELDRSKTCPGTKFNLDGFRTQLKL